jgi:hypothetical protein
MHFRASSFLVVVQSANWKIKPGFLFMGDLTDMANRAWPIFL